MIEVYNKKIIKYTKKNKKYKDWYARTEKWKSIYRTDMKNNSDINIVDVNKNDNLDRIEATAQTDNKTNKIGEGSNDLDDQT